MQLKLAEQLGKRFVNPVPTKVGGVQAMLSSTEALDSTSNFWGLTQRAFAI